MIARAHLHSFRQPARKVRVLLDLIRGKPVEEAFRLLSFARKRPAEDVLKLLRSAVANAGQKGEHPTTSLYVSGAWADGGLMWKKMEPKAMLRNGIMKRRTSHVTIEVDEIGGTGGAAAGGGGA